MKFLHCADIHLDSPLRGLANYEGAPAEEIRGATRRAFENLVDLAVDEAVTAVVIAGDIYDGDRDDYNTARFLQRHFERLKEEGIPVVVVYGNHDAANEITKRLRPPDNVTIFPHEEATTVEMPGVGIAFHGRSYPNKVVNEDFSATYPPAVSGMLNVGVLHTSLSGHEGPHARYAPCTETGLADRGYDYWALGHVHERYQTQRDGAWIVYPGNLQGRKSNEVGAKGATVVSYDGDQVTAVEHRTLDVVRWVVCDVSVDDVRNVDEVPARVIEQLRDDVEAADGRLLAARVRIRGRTPVADDILLKREAWEAQLRADAGGASERVWIEKVDVSVTEPDDRDAAEAGEAIDAIRAAIREATNSEDVRRDLEVVFADLRSKLGSDLEDLREMGLPDLGVVGIGELLPDVEALLVAAMRDGEA